MKQPAFNVELGVSEVELLREGQVLITFLHPAAPANHGIVQELARRGVIALTLDSIPRISRAQTMDALTSMSTVAGYKAVISAANRLPKFLPMLGTAVGMVQPAQVVVIGAGVAGLRPLPLQALRCSDKSHGCTAGCGRTGQEPGSQDY